HYLEQVFETETLVSEDGEYNSLAGFLLAHFENMPAVGEVLELDDLRYEILEADERRIASVDVRRIEPDHSL
ncbi:MAG: transporter associated domain-containing protein, partial [Janthinobacterium sp.]